jgi:hypothetical protein
VLFSPAKTFESIARKPGWDWVIPMVLLMAGVVILQSIAVPKIDVDEAVAQQMKVTEKMMGNEIPADKRDEIEEQIRDQFDAAEAPASQAGADSVHRAGDVPGAGHLSRDRRRRRHEDDVHAPGRRVTPTRRRSSSSL